MKVLFDPRGFSIAAGALGTVPHSYLHSGLAFHITILLAVIGQAFTISSTIPTRLP
jgi:hypothetical protein